MNIDKVTFEPKQLSIARELARSMIGSMQMPSQKEEAWKYTDLSKVELENFGKGNFSLGFSGVDNVDGCVITTFKDAFKKHPDLSKRFSPFGLIKSDSDKIIATHAACLEDGLFIYVPKGKSMTANITLRLAEGLCISHVVIVLEESSSLNFTEEITGNNLGFSSHAVEIHLGRNSKLNLSGLNSANKGSLISRYAAKLDADSSIKWVFAGFSGGLSRIKADTFFEGRGSSGETFAVFYGKGDSHFDITTDAYHNTTNTTNNILVKGALAGKATSVYRGKIKIERGAQQTNSYLSDHTLLLSKDSVSNSIPSPEIDANDVKASHGATIGKPDEEELFYLMARGMEKKKAERLLIEGYFSEVIDKADASFAKKIRILLEEEADA